MDDTIVTSLEHAVADLGTLLVQMEKFRARHSPDAVALRARCLAIGDGARRAHRQGALAGPTAAALLDDATAAKAALEGWLVALRAGPAFARAREAMQAPCSPALADALVAVFDDTHVEAAPGWLYHPLPWRRRGRPRPVDELLAEVVGARRDGLVGDGDPLAPGVDPDVPGVRCHRGPPLGEPIALLACGSALPPWVLAFGSIDDVVVPGPRYVGGFSVWFPNPDDVELDDWVGDPAAFIATAAAAVSAAAIPVIRSTG